MKYTEEYLKTLVGLPVEDAAKKVKDDLGMKCDIYSHNAIISAIARNSVVLYHKDEIITAARAGDPTKLQ